MGLEDLGFGEFALVGQLEELAVGHGGPEEVRQAGGEFEVVEAPLGFAGLVVFLAEEEGGVKEEGAERAAEGVLVIVTGLEAGREESDESVELLVGDAAAEGEAGLEVEDLFRGCFR